MKISIFTDASVVGDSAGYAFYIGCTAGKIQKAGILRVKTNLIILAELHSLANALHTLLHGKFKPITKVWVFMDWEPAVHILNGTQREYSKEYARKVMDEIFFLMLDICIKSGKPIREVNNLFTFQHIKAHTGNKDRLSQINHWCDVNSRKYAREGNRKLTNNGK